MAQSLSDTIGSLIDEMADPFTIDEIIQQAAARRGAAVTPRLRASAE